MSAITLSKKDARRFQLCAELGLAPPRPKRKREPRILPNNPNRCVEHPETFDFVIPVKTENNNGGFALSPKAVFALSNRKRKERALAIKCAFEEGVPNLLAYQSARITMRRGAYGKGMDPNNLGTALKHVQDGIADALGFKDDYDRRLKWRFENAKAKPKDYWVAVKIEIACEPESGLLEGKE